MSKIYLFAIGGTGSRVLRALTMLLAAGVKTNVSEFVPIIIDPDAACGDKTDTILLLDRYAALYDTQSHHHGRSIDDFKAKLTKLPFVMDYVMPMGTNTNSTFANYMQFGSLSPQNRALVNMLFSDSNQEADMTIGFTGNPNIGSVVLNQFTSSEEFLTFASSFNPGDKIFIISSIFGGTGASGFPLLLKNLRNIDPSLGIPNSAAIQTAEIGALTMLPYFSVDSRENSAVDSDTFVSKTKSALSYYEKNLTGLNYLYYLGDDARGRQEYNDGGALQRNDAHFVELAAALAVLDFADAPQSSSAGTIYKEFGIQDDVTDITLRNLSVPTYLQIAPQLTEFTLASKFIKEKLMSSLTQTWVSQLGASVVSSHIFNNTLIPFIDAYLMWLSEMESPRHARRFTPFVLEPRPADVFGLVKGMNPKSVWTISSKNWDLFNHFLNNGDCSKQANQLGVNLDGRLLAHILYGARKVVSKKFQF